MSGLAILSIAVLGKHGNPLFLESYSNRRGGQADLKWHYAAHTALDFFEERDAPAYKTTDSYLGMLYAMEDYAVYAVVSSFHLCDLAANEVSFAVTAIKPTLASDLSLRSRSQTQSSETSTCARYVSKSLHSPAADQVFKNARADPVHVQIFRAIHNAYIRQLSNPFTPLDAETTTGFDAPITNRRFAEVMATIAGRGPETAST
ncbi:hypothetical protein C6P46_006701 [Rhodotorula mucilaginosa]|uniref:Trafficking protein particle complex subunit 2 n=1 Tax=Rhodotorula mucilaginosa TaxID=5537 RepID=A0A9P7B3W1_RHOMI|nr:hypothetical protein C6P46_006701 [Rhodotorula mucilaginosa]